MQIQLKVLHDIVKSVLNQDPATVFTCLCECRLQQCPDEYMKKVVYSLMYRQVSNIRRTLTGYKFVDHSDVVGAAPVGAAPTTSSFST